VVRHTAREVLAARRDSQGWEEQLRAGLLAFAREVAETPEGARLALIEAFACPSAFARMEHTIGLFETLLARSFASANDGREMPPLVVTAIVEGIVQVALARLLSDREASLPEEVDGLVRWAASLCDPAAAEVFAATESLAPAGTAPQASGANYPPNRLLGDERRMILSVTARLVAEEGYAALTMPRIGAAAGLSRRRLESHFENVNDCFLGVLELLTGRVLANARHAYFSAPDWPTGVRLAIASICRELAEDPALAKFALSEVFAAGRDAVDWRATLAANLSSFLHGSAPLEQQLTELEAEASIGAVGAVLRHYGARDEAKRVWEATQVLSYLVLAPALGARETADLLRAEREAA